MGLRKRLEEHEKLFLRPQVQLLLRNLCGRNLDKVFSKRQLEKIRTSDIRLLTEQELKEVSGFLLSGQCFFAPASRQTNVSALDSYYFILD